MMIMAANGESINADIILELSHRYFVQKQPAKSSQLISTLSCHL